MYKILHLYQTTIFIRFYFNISKKVIGKKSNNTTELSAILYLYDIVEKDLLAGKKML